MLWLKNELDVMDRMTSLSLKDQSHLRRRYDCKRNFYRNINNLIQETEDRRRQAEIKRAEEQMKAKKRESVNRTIGVTVGVLTIGGVIVAVLCMVSRNSNRKPPTPIAATSVPTRTTVEQLRPLISHTAQSPYRPIETNIAPYPPTSFAVRPTAPTAVEPETPPPPSYTEAVNNMRPTAPAITT
ncbi:uncharacterized protein LOC116162267 isoform X4 [Photinus pyralis]|uniref:uncharacterized protein LOC116162266 isoform X4 n=1 Tax=Photinus pyralis TaxID=7054 RepID=UPI001267560A|nr:uncharacterized protein LOC116162266 isoform X4 [Photinus pyralis]XP_031331726.1 uncharacterized protein LOC116162267 isoform X4 [Photinus pyralis]